ncbi:hypothetical protein MAR_016478 [Mya arenaria]|uniref:Uncharacterized protein n=1 Tax=Mya arenaria TaxID=6604 RepID=A0ABY7FNR9_MYAAR|nr:hypothetical protein MAR_016478 [Mya arenaria]
MKLKLKVSLRLCAVDCVKPWFSVRIRTLNNLEMSTCLQQLKKDGLFSISIGVQTSPNCLY